MRLQLQYILFVLLFVTVGALCRVSRVQGAHSVEACEPCSLAQTLKADCAVRAELVFAGSTTTDNMASGRFFAYSFFAPELVCSHLSQHTDSKAASRVSSLFGHDVPPCPAVAGRSEAHAAGVGFSGVDYYVYMLGKILI